MIFLYIYWRRRRQENFEDLYSRNHGFSIKNQYKINIIDEKLQKISRLRRAITRNSILYYNYHSKV